MLSGNRKKKVVIFGLGSIGSRHAELLLDKSECELFAFRSSKKAAKNRLGIKELFSWQELRSINPDIALISNPTDQHIKTALKCAALGMHLFIEKPVSHDLKGIAELKKIVQKNKLTVYIAYCLRFHPVIKKARELLLNKKILHVRSACASFLPDWRGGRETYSSFKSQGGGVLLDISHELDYVSYIFGRIKRIEGEFGRSADVTRDAEDFADIFAVTERAIPSNIHLDYFSRKSERTLKVAFNDGYLSGDLLANSLDFVSDGKKRSFKFRNSRNDYLLEQWDYFIDHIGQRSIMNSLDEASGLLKNILELKNG
jgi:predicted dehydrogenase